MGIWDWLRRGAGTARSGTTPPSQTSAPPSTAPPITPVTPAAPFRPGHATASPKNAWEEVEQVLVWTIPAILLSTVILTFALVMNWLHGAGRADEKVLFAGASALFACVALVFLMRLIRSLDAGEMLGVESYWGGLGGGVGGWRISITVAYFIGVTTFAALAAVAVSNYWKTRPESFTNPAATDTKGPAAATGTTNTTRTTTTGTTATSATTGTVATATQSTPPVTTTKAP